MLQDLRHAAHVLVRDKLRSTVIVLCIAVGLGANTALFTAINGLLLRQVEVDDPTTLVRFNHVGANQMNTEASEYGGSGPRSTFSYFQYEAMRAANQTLVDLFAGAPLARLNVTIAGRGTIASAYIATGNYQTILGVRPVVGRLVMPSDDRPGADAVATISEPFWSREFARDPSAIGTTIAINGVPATIVGVVPEAFRGVQRPTSPTPDLVLPLVVDDQIIRRPPPARDQPLLPPRRLHASHWWLQVVGRLRPGVTPTQVQDNLQGVFQQAARDGLSSFVASLPNELREQARYRDRAAVPTLTITSAAHGIYDADPVVVRAIAVITGMVGLLLLLVCANVANLQLARGAFRDREFVVRLSLGATRGRLVRQLLVESVVLAAVGGLLGLLVAEWTRALLPGGTNSGPVDGRVLLFSTVATVLTGILFGIAPALTVARRAQATVAAASRSTTHGPMVLSRVLVVVQVAISVVLLAGASLFLQTLSNLRGAHLGFEPANLVVFRVEPLLNGYDQPRMAAFYDRLMAGLAALPGVQAATMSNPALMTGVNSTNFVVDGRPYTPGPHNTINRVRVAPNFLAVLGIPMLRGRTLSERDRAESPPVAMINEAAARRFFPDDDPLGRRFGPDPDHSGTYEIVGVVKDARYNDLREPPPPTIYVPYAQSPLTAMAIEVRTRTDPAVAGPSIREAVRAVDATIPVLDLSTQTRLIEDRLQQERVFARAYALLGAMALVVASAGLFGMMSYIVSQRTREIGVRLALGAQRGVVLASVLRMSMAMVVLGVASGVPAALAAGRLVRAWLFGLNPGDLSSHAAAIVLVATVSMIAGYLPAYRASWVDPLVALRHD